MKQTQNFLFPFIILFVMIVSGSCSKSSNTTTSNSSTPGTVTIANMAFSPLSLSVKVGTTVTWKNNDGFAHTVTSNDGTSFNANLAGGGSFSYTTKTVGTFDYHCTIHPGMTGTLIVTQ